MPTESQWRAALAVERFTDMDVSYYDHIHEFKRALGGVFALANFWTGIVRVAPNDRIDYHVIERDSRMIFGHAHETRAEALAEARELIEAMGRHLLVSTIAERARRVLPAKPSRKAKERRISRRAGAIFAASNGRCHYCGCELSLYGKWHIEHKMPRALFGGSEQSNLVAACAPCNFAKRDKTELEFMHELQSRKAGH